MKFILTGCTGFIGGEVMSQCLRNPSITSIVTLSRRELSDAFTNDPKVKAIVVRDFNTYPESTLKELAGADACIWCMGTTAGDKALEVDYPLAFGNSFSSTISENHKFRYIHLSGAATERDQDKSLWFKAEMRKLKGQAEENMLAFSKREETKGLWETLIIKSGFVIAKEIKTPRDVMGWMMGTKRCIRVDELASVMIDAAFNGWKESTMSDTQAMVTRGRQVLGKWN